MTDGEQTCSARRRAARTAEGSRSTAEVALTEYGIARPVPGDNSPSADMKTRAAQGMARSPYFASLTTRDLLRLYGRGIGTVISWEFQDPVWGKASYGLLDPEGNERPVYHALASVSSAPDRSSDALLHQLRRSGDVDAGSVRSPAMDRQSDARPFSNPARYARRRSVRPSPAGHVPIDPWTCRHNGRG